MSPKMSFNWDWRSLFSVFLSVVSCWTVLNSFLILIMSCSNWLGCVMPIFEVGLTALSGLVTCEADPFAMSLYVGFL